jgi:16S rRNA A1518/A1519 N6-dimethyltransferase RsmA/KsgA/DIM1 with predicted DNA glycosylase/AP lyase activity
MDTLELYEDALRRGQLNLFEETETQAWDSDDWETPTWLAQKIAGLLRPDEQRVLEPSAGSGQIVWELLQLGHTVTAIEPNPNRFVRLPQSPNLQRHLGRFENTKIGSFDVVVTNPPFTMGIEFLRLALKHIKPDGRVLFLLPSDYFQAQGRAKEFSRLNCHISKMWPIVGRVAYLRNGTPESNRQCYDSVFEFRRGQCDAPVTPIMQKS